MALRSDIGFKRRQTANQRRWSSKQLTPRLVLCLHRETRASSPAPATTWSSVSTVSSCFPSCTGAHCEIIQPPTAAAEEENQRQQISCGTSRNPEEQPGTRGNQGEPGGTRGNQVEPGGTRGRRGDPFDAVRSSEEEF